MNVDNADKMKISVNLRSSASYFIPKLPQSQLILLH